MTHAHLGSSCNFPEGGKLLAQVQQKIVSCWTAKAEVVFTKLKSLHFCNFFSSCLTSAELIYDIGNWKFTLEQWRKWLETAYSSTLLLCEPIKRIWNISIQPNVTLGWMADFFSWLLHNLFPQQGLPPVLSYLVSYHLQVSDWTTFFPESYPSIYWQFHQCGPYYYLCQASFCQGDSWAAYRIYCIPSNFSNLGYLILSLSLCYLIIILILSGPNFSFAHK